MAQVPAGEREELQSTARELARWQGHVEAQVGEQGGHLKKINGSMEKVAQRLGAIEERLAIALGTDTAESRFQDQARRWRMWAIGLGITTVLALTSLAITVTIPIVLYLTSH